MSSTAIGIEHKTSGVTAGLPFFQEFKLLGFLGELLIENAWSRLSRGAVSCTLIIRSYAWRKPMFHPPTAGEICIARHALQMR